ncbi:MAG: class I SAM-dependent methyltransferase [FCB group bacterium]|nr:class I SAM-dependent methyltransferase [FCB group bacterium]
MPLTFIRRSDYHNWQSYYWKYQYLLAEEYYLPLLKNWDIPVEGKKVLDIGCGDGGFTSAVAVSGADCTGVEMRDFRWEVADNPRFLIDDITRPDALKTIGHSYDIIILRDVIEHIPLEQKSGFITAIHQFMADDAVLLITFPPFYSPFGLHQQTQLKTGFKKIPYLGWLPAALLKWILNLAGEKPEDINGVLDIKNCRMTISGFNKLVRNTGFQMIWTKFFFVRPSHEIRLGWKTRSAWLGRIPILREVFTLGTVFLLKRG